MARYGKRFPIANVDINFVAGEIGKYLTGEGFKLIDYKGQKVWKKGVGMVTAPQYIAVTYTPQEIILEAFIKYALLPGVYVGEMGLDGGMGFAVKALLRTRVDAVEAYLLSILQQQYNAYMAQQAPPQPV